MANLRRGIDVYKSHTLSKCHFEYHQPSACISILISWIDRVCNSNSITTANITISTQKQKQKQVVGFLLPDCLSIVQPSFSHLHWPRPMSTCAPCALRIRERIRSASNKYEKKAIRITGRMDRVRGRDAPGNVNFFAIPHIWEIHILSFSHFSQHVLPHSAIASQFDCGEGIDALYNHFSLFDSNDTRTDEWSNGWNVWTQYVMRLLALASLFKLMMLSTHTPDTRPSTKHTCGYLPKANEISNRTFHDFMCALLSVCLWTFSFLFSLRASHFRIRVHWK